MGKSRANAQYMQEPQPTATERLQKALNRPVNEAIQIDKPEPKTLEDIGQNARDANKAKGRGQYINDIVDKASR
jgi:3-methyladenine DNA glycosylase/8-oxoguanine DNA glycosylase